ncbi:MAG: MFS transporter, partial [Anaerolineaceae bacterium]|nr:MFS transporter [Anaerolineaceae bacterium]
MSREHLQRLGLFGFIYFAEGAMLTFFSSYNTIYLRGFDLSFTRIGIASTIIMLPFILKIFIGLISDRVNLFGQGHRKPYIILGLALQTAGLLLIPLIHPGNQFPLYVLLLVFICLGMSIYDTTTDGFSIDVTPADQRGIAQGAMVGGRALSQIVTALVVGFLTAQGKWSTSFMLIAAVSAATLVYSLFIPAPKIRPASQAFDKRAFKSMWNWAFILFLIVGMGYPLALFGAHGMVSPFLNEGMGIPLDVVGQLVALLGVGTVIGALLGGPIVKRYGRRTSIYAAVIATALISAAFALTDSLGMAAVFVFLLGMCFGYYETVYMAMGMDFTDPRIGAFMFSFIMAVGNLGIGLGGPIGGIILDRMNFSALFL